jgi:Glycosyltransferase family 87
VNRPLTLGARPRSLSRTTVMAVLAAMVLLCSVALDLLLLPHDGGLGHDFSAFYAAGLTLRHGHDPYSWSQLGATEAHLRSIGDPRQPMGFNPYANPPLFAWALAAFTVVPERPAYVIWLAAMVAAMLGSVVLLASCDGMGRRRWALLVFAVTPAPVIGYFLGQQTPLLLVALAAALAALRHKRPALAGVMLTVGWIKPHLIFPIALVLVAMLGWPQARRLLVGFLCASVLFGLASWLVTGKALVIAWVRDLSLYGHTLDTVQPDLSSLAGVYLSVVGRPWSACIGAAIVGAWLLFAVLLVRKARRESLAPADDRWLRLVALALASWLLATPYAHPADLVLLAPVLPVFLGRHLGGLADPRVRLALGMLLVAPEADLLGFRPNLWLSYSVLVPLTMLIALRPWHIVGDRRVCVGSPGDATEVGY